MHVPFFVVMIMYIEHVSTIYTILLRCFIFQGEKNAFFLAQFHFDDVSWRTGTNITACIACTIIDTWYMV